MLLTVQVRWHELQRKRYLFTEVIKLHGEAAFNICLEEFDQFTFILLKLSFIIYKFLIEKNFISITKNQWIFACILCANHCTVFFTCIFNDEQFLCYLTDVDIEVHKGLSNYQGYITDKWKKQNADPNMSGFKTWALTTRHTQNNFSSNDLQQNNRSLFI